MLKDAFENSLKNPDYGFIDSNEELLLNEATIMLHGKKWDGYKWVRSLERILGLTLKRDLLY